MQSLLFIIGHFGAAAILAGAGNWIGLIPWRRASGAHWTERARLLWPARTTGLMNIFIIPILLNEIHRLSGYEVEPHWMVNALSAALGVLYASYFFDHELYPELKFRGWFAEAVSNWGMRIGMWFGLLAAAWFMPAEMGWGMLGIVVLFLTGHFALQFGLALRFLEWTGFITPASERMLRIVRETCERANRPVVPVMEFGGVAAQAFAVITIGKLLFSKRLLEICSDEEVSAVCAHELAHLNESRFVVAGRLAGSLMFFPLIFINPVASATTYGIVFILLCPSMIIFFSNRLSRKLEERADSSACDAVSPLVYASALEKIYRANQLPAVLPGKRQTHPDLYDRLLAAGVTPEYQRPRPPRRFTWMFFVFVGAWVALFILGIIER